MKLAFSNHVTDIDTNTRKENHAKFTVTTYLPSSRKTQKPSLSSRSGIALLVRQNRHTSDATRKAHTRFNSGIAANRGTSAQPSFSLSAV